MPVVFWYASVYIKIFWYYNLIYEFIFISLDSTLFKFLNIFSSHWQDRERERERERNIKSKNLVEVKKMYQNLKHKTYANDQQTFLYQISSVYIKKALV